MTLQYKHLYVIQHLRFFTWEHIAQNIDKTVFLNQISNKAIKKEPNYD